MVYKSHHFKQKKIIYTVNHKKSFNSMTVLNKNIYRLSNTNTITTLQKQQTKINANIVVVQ